MKFPVIIAVRLGSSRLPGKALLPMLDGTCILDEIIKRVRNSDVVDKICIATTLNKEDDRLAEFAELNDLFLFRGSENNVAERIHCAAQYLNAEYFFEVLGDNPLIDPNFFQLLHSVYLKNEHLKYASFNTKEYNFDSESEFPVGVRVQLVKTDLFEEILATNDPYYLEHATSFFYDKIDQNYYFLVQNFDVKDCSHYNLAVNTLEDFLLVSSVLNESTNFNWINSLELYKLFKK
jgi:spore coat polysaccharide biosynthesis protein SpsF